MKLLLLLAFVAFVAARPEDDYSRYDNFDTDEVISNFRLLKSYVLCFLGTGKCTPEGNDIKGWVPDAMQSNCGKCSENQKVLVAKVLSACIDKMPEEWKDLNKMHNPEGKYDVPIKEFIKKYDH